MRKKITNTILICIVLLLVIVNFQFGKFTITDSNSNNVDKEILEYLQPLKKGIVISTMLISESKSKVYKLNTKKGIIPGIEALYETSLKVQYSNSTIEENFFTQQTLQKTKVFVPTSPGYKKGELTDLRPGDEIIFKKTLEFNLVGKTRTPKIVNIEIIKIK